MVYTYEVNEDEIEESADLEVPGEGPGGGDGDGSDDEDEDEYYDYEEDAVPVRLLDDFTIYDSNTLEVIPTSQLLEGLGEVGFSQRVNYSASGEVRPWTEDPDEAPDDELELEEGDLQRQYERVKLTRITRFSVHHVGHHPVVEQHKLTTLDGYVVCILDCGLTHCSPVQENICLHQTCMVHPRLPLAPLLPLLPALLADASHYASLNEFSSAQQEDE